MNILQTETNPEGSASGTSSLRMSHGLKGHHPQEESNHAIESASTRFAQLVQAKVQDFDHSSFLNIFWQCKRWLFVETRTSPSPYLTSSSNIPQLDTRKALRHPFVATPLHLTDRARRKFGLSRLAFLLLLLLAFFGLKDAWTNRVHTTQTSPIGTSQHPSLLQHAHSFDRLPRALQPIEPDVTAVLLNWKRLDSLSVIVKQLCDLPFIQSILIWNVSRSPIHV